MEMKADKKFYQKWWIWTGVAAILVGAIVSYILLNTGQPSDSQNIMTGPAAEVLEESVTVGRPVPLPAVSESIEEANALPVFDFTIEEWVNTQNRLNEEVGIPTLNYDHIALQDGQFTINQSQYVFYLGRLNSSGDIYAIMMGGFGDGSTESGYEIAVSMAVLVSSLHPEYSRAQSGAVIGELGILDNERPDESALVKDGTEYTFLNDAELGMMLFAAPAE